MCQSSGSNCCLEKSKLTCIINEGKKCLVRALARFIDRHVTRFRPITCTDFEMRYNKKIQNGDRHFLREEVDRSGRGLFCGEWHEEWVNSNNQMSRNHLHCILGAKWTEQQVTAMAKKWFPGELGVVWKAWNLKSGSPKCNLNILLRLSGYAMFPTWSLGDYCNRIF